MKIEESGGVLCMAASKDWKTFIAAGKGFISKISAETFKYLIKKKVESNIWRCCLSQDEKHVYMAEWGSPNRVLSHNVGTLDMISEVHRHSNRVFSLLLLKTKNILLSGSYGVIMVTNLSNNLTKEIKFGSKYFHSLFSTEGEEKIYCGNASGELFELEVATNKFKLLHMFSSGVTSLEMLEKEGKLFCGLDDKTLSVFNFVENQVISTSKVLGGCINHLFYDKETKTLFSSSDDNKVNLINPESLKVIQTLSHHNNYVYQSLYNYKIGLISCSADKTIQLTQPSSLTGLREKMLKESDKVSEPAKKSDEKNSKNSQLESALRDLTISLEGERIEKQSLRQSLREANEKSQRMKADFEKVVEGLTARVKSLEGTNAELVQRYTSLENNFNLAKAKITELRKKEEESLMNSSFFKGTLISGKPNGKSLLLFEDSLTKSSPNGANEFFRKNYIIKRFGNGELLLRVPEKNISVLGTLEDPLADPITTIKPIKIKTSQFTILPGNTGFEFENLSFTGNAELIIDKKAKLVGFVRSNVFDFQPTNVYKPSISIYGKDFLIKSISFDRVINFGENETYTLK